MVVYLEGEKFVSGIRGAWIILIFKGGRQEGHIQLSRYIYH